MNMSIHCFICTIIISSR